MLLRRILVPTDLSPESAPAASYAAALARARGSHVYLAHFIRTSERRARALRELEALAHTVPGCDCEIIVEAAEPVVGIVDLARRLEADLIVMASRGRKGLARRVLGSTAEAVVRAAACPVMVARVGHGRVIEYGPEGEAAEEEVIVPVLDLSKRKPTAEDLYFARLDRESLAAARNSSRDVPGPRLHLQRILAPTDLSAASLQAIDFAAEMARAFGAKVELLYVADPRSAAYGALTSSADRGSFDFPEIEPLVRQLQEIGNRISDVFGASSIAFGRPRRSIVAVATRKGSDLIVMATRGRTSALTPLALGSTAEGVVRRAPCPVITIRVGVAAAQPQPV